MDEAALDKLKLYMRVDGDDSDTLIQSLWASANDYLANAGIADNGSDLYWLAAAGLTLHWFDSAPSVTGTDSNIPLGLRNIINQLKMTDSPEF